MPQKQILAILLIWTRARIGVVQARICGNRARTAAIGIWEHVLHMHFNMVLICNVYYCSDRMFTPCSELLSIPQELLRNAQETWRQVRLIYNIFSALIYPYHPLYLSLKKMSETTRSKSNCPTEGPWSEFPKKMRKFDCSEIYRNFLSRKWDLSYPPELGHGNWDEFVRWHLAKPAMCQ